ncbi:RUN domain-containing protein 3B-like isoform X2 [Haliotis rubra]|uniref:RUN domain-containing protein 3B-like isoform X2 n=1 Tax=Haliotis rubra TaxID=36100 RepID=UPI001EE61E72|nr:RUN domain-containing protein 3B-like isoform X2 [Haliotis rubra]
MDDNKNTNTRLSNRQIQVARRNVVSVCRFCVKSLIDKACFSNIDDECEEFINFCAVLEQVLLHRIRPYRTTWYRGGDNRSFWEYVRAACRHVPQSCIASIDAIENIKSPSAKGRAFIRCALMEKKLSEYLGAAIKQQNITRKHYLDGAIMLSEDANMLCGVFLGLNTIDFSFCLKGENMDLLGPLVIDFTPFLQFHQSDLEEMRELSNSSISSSIMSEDVVDDASWRNKYKNLEHKFKSACEQKGYLEELVRLRERQVEEISADNQRMEMRLQYVEAEGQRDRLMLENVVLELQEQLATVKSERQTLQQRLSLLLAMRQPPGPRQVREIQMADMASEGIHSAHSTGELDLISSTRHLQNVQQQDNKSLLSGSSGQFTAKEDNHSMIPLTGSLTDVQVRPMDTPVHQSGKTEHTEMTELHSPSHQDADPSREAPGQQRHESTDIESSTEVEADYRERAPALAFPSFSCVDLDGSLDTCEDEEAGDLSALAAEDMPGDPLGIEKGRVKPTQAVDTADNQETESEGDKLESKEDDDCVSDVNNSNGDLVESNEKTDSGNSDYDIVNPDNEKSSSNESSIELAEALDSGKSDMALGESTEDEYLRIGSDEGQSDSQTDIPHEKEENSDEEADDSKKQASDRKETDASDPAENVSSGPENQLDEEKMQIEPVEQTGKDAPLSPGGDSGSSEGDKEWDFVSDSQGNGQTVSAKEKACDDQKDEEAS